MGIRLYPNTKNVANLEILAGVPAGTAQKLTEIEARHPNRHGVNNWSAVEAFYDELYLKENSDVNAYQHFLLNGWGKFDHCGIVDSFDVECCGSENDAQKIRMLFALNGINADVSLCEGISWS